jgi:hypothetical protein
VEFLVAAAFDAVEVCDVLASGLLVADGES